MADDVEQPRRGRGRPRMPDEDKKRHSMTFRMRTDLRAAVEELAHDNGRSMSEQIEYYIEKGVSGEVGLAYQYGMAPISPTLFKCVTGIDKNAPGLGAALSREVGPNGEISKEDTKRMDALTREMGARMFPMMADIFEGMLGADVPPWIKQSGQEGRKAFEQIQLREAERELALRRTERERSLEAELIQARAEIRALKSRISGDEPCSSDEEGRPLSIEGIEAEFARALGRPIAKSDESAGGSEPITEDQLLSLMKRMRDLAEGHGSEQVNQLTQKQPRMPLPADMPSPDPHRANDLSIAALRDLVVRLTTGELDLEAMRAAGWPAPFGLLPSDTRTALIGELRDDAPDVYEALMSPTGPRSEALTALRRLQSVLLPHGADAGDEEVSDVERRSAQVRR